MSRGKVVLPRVKALISVSRYGLRDHNCRKINLLFVYDAPRCVEDQCSTTASSILAQRSTTITDD